MTPGEWVGMGSGLTAITIGVLKGRAPAGRWLRMRRQHYEEHAGRPDRMEGGKVVEKGHASLALGVAQIAASVDDLKTSMVRLADTVTANDVRGEMQEGFRVRDVMHEENRQAVRELRGVADHNSEELEKVRDAAAAAQRTAGEAAMLAARTRQEATDQLESIAVTVKATDAKIDDLRERTGERFEALEEENQALRSIAHELGMPIEEDPK